MSNYLKSQLRETLSVVDTCLQCIYQKESHMYRVLAAQLRLLLCDRNRGQDNSLIQAVYPDLEVSPVRSIGWSSTQAGAVRLQSESGAAQIGQMPIVIKSYSNGLVVADLSLDGTATIPIARWSAQQLTFHPEIMTISDVIRTVADKGGGAHVDRNSSRQLQLMYASTPSGRTYAELFIIAISRFAQRLLERIFDVTGVRVASELERDVRVEYDLLVVANEELIRSRPPQT